MQSEAQAALRRVWLKQEQARYQQRSAIQPDDVVNWRKLARIYGELGELESALTALERALALQADDREDLLGYAMVCLALHRNPEALAATGRILAQNPHDIDALLRQIEALRRLGRSAEILAICERTLELPNLDPARRVTVLNAQALALGGEQRNVEALAVIEALLTLTPNDPVPRLHRAILQVRLRRFNEALDGIEVLVAAPVTQFRAACLQAQALAMLRRFDEADIILNDLQARYPHRALEEEFEPWRLPEEALPDSVLKRYTARGLYLIDFFAAQARCDWHDRDAVLAQLDDFAADALRYGFVAGIEPFSLLMLPAAPALQLAVAQAQAQIVSARMAPIREGLRIEWPTSTKTGRLRIGYVSGDFREHATAHLARKLFQVHDRTQFEVIAFSLRPDDGGFYRQDIAAHCDQFVELSGLSHAEAALRIAQEGIHILVDMHGYTRFSRPELFALQPAPVQVAFLGYPGSLGADYIPYAIVDPVVLPQELRPYFSEQPVYLPCYQVNDDEQPIATTGMTRTDAGLPAEAFVFCCFNKTDKIEPRTFAAWMRILQHTPGSVLWLLVDNEDQADGLRLAAQSHAVEPERLFFASRLPKAEHLERHALADLFLDTFVYNAHTTASDALWAGLPIVTLRGDQFQSRVCASLLTALGLPELIADTVGEFESRAIALAHCPETLEALRVRLQARRRVGSPFETQYFVCGLEQAFTTMWLRYQAGQPLEPITIQLDTNK